MPVVVVVVIAGVAFLLVMVISRSMRATKRASQEDIPVVERAEDIALYRRLLNIRLGNKRAVEAMIEEERQRNPSASKYQLMEGALERWLEENRSWRV